jgi:hypothetical protein
MEEDSEDEKEDYSKFGEEETIRQIALRFIRYVVVCSMYHWPTSLKLMLNRNHGVDLTYGERVHFFFSEVLPTFSEWLPAIMDATNPRNVAEAIMRFEQHYQHCSSRIRSCITPIIDASLYEGWKDNELVQGLAAIQQNYPRYKLDDFLHALSSNTNIYGRLTAARASIYGRIQRANLRMVEEFFDEGKASLNLRKRYVYDDELLDKEDEDGDINNKANQPKRSKKRQIKLQARKVVVKKKKIKMTTSDSTTTKTTKTTTTSYITAVSNYTYSLSHDIILSIILIMMSDRVHLHHRTSRASQ